MTSAPNATSQSVHPEGQGREIHGRGKRTLRLELAAYGRASTDVSGSPQLSAHSARYVLNGTARIARAAHTKIVSDMNPESLSHVKSGDVLVSHPTAVREHEISVIPNAPHAMSATHDTAVSDGRSEADAIGVDAWLTEDQAHVVKIASHRLPDK